MELPAALAKQRRELTKLWLKWRFAIVASLLAVAVLVAARYTYESYTTHSAEARREEIRTAAGAFAHALSERLQADLAPVSKSARAPDLPGLLEHGDPAAIAAREADIARTVPHVLRVRLLKPGVGDVDYGQSPPLDYAGIQMMRDIEESPPGKRLPPEVHLFGGKQQHVAFLRRIFDGDGKLVGLALFALDVKMLADAVKAVPFDGAYAELRQPVIKNPPVVVAFRGDTALRKLEPGLLLNVPGTEWQVAYWLSGGGEALSEGTGLVLWAGGAVILVLLLAGAAAAILRRRRPAPAPAVAEAAAAPADAIAVAVREAPAPQGGSGPEAEALAQEPAEGAGLESVTVVDVPASIFRAYDIRGVVGKTLTAEIVREIGRAIGSEARARGQQTVVTGRDGRTSGPELHEALTEGLRATGCDVIDIGRVPTPVLYFATYYLNTGSGVMVTGSHNPPQYNGLKVMLAEETLSGDAITALRTRIRQGELTSGQGKLQSMDLVPEYIRRVSEDVPVALGNAFRVVVDCGNGVAGEVAPKLLRALGHDVVELYCEVDGKFPNHHPDPSQPENLRDLIAAVKENKADLGFAFDGDGDRLGIVDGQGNIIWPDRQMMLYARDVLSRNRGAQIVFDVKCSSRLGKVIRKLGGEPIMWKTGHSFIKRKMRETGALLAGEMSGHIFFKERWYGFDDALYTSARMLEILLGLKQPPTAVFSKLPSGVSTPELRLDMEEGRHLEFMQRLAAENRFADGRVTTIDGVRVDYPDGWGLVRASNTTPCLVLRFEGDTRQALERVQDTFRKVLLGLDPGLELPF